MDELLKEAFHTYQIYLATSGVLDVHEAKLGILKWPDIVQSSFALIDAIEENKENKEDIRSVLIRDIEQAVLDPIKALFQSALTRAVSVAGDKVGPELLHATKKDTETDVVKLKDEYISRVNAIFAFLEKESGKKYPKIKTQTELPVISKAIV